MNVERGLRSMAGVVVLGSIGLSLAHSQWWLALTAFVGANLLQSGFTNWCPGVFVLERLGLKRCDADGCNERVDHAG